jgi:hypothetical protein
VDVGRRWLSSRFTWAERERGRGSWAEGANGRGELGEQGAGLKRGAGARTWPENARSWARPRQGDRGREVRDGLTRGDGGTERGRAGARERTSADRSGPRDREREGERGRSVCADRQGPPVRHRGRAGARARARGGWARWVDFGRIGLFYFPGICIAFSIYFL